MEATMSKQTAVEWLQECLSIHITDDQKMQFEGLFQQAKAMEKEQIVNTYRDGRTDQQSEVITYAKLIKPSIQHSITDYGVEGIDSCLEYKDSNEMIDHIVDANKMVFPKDINGVVVKLGDKIQGIGSLKFQDGFEIDRTPIVTANIQNGKLYFGNLSAESFTLGFKIVESAMVEDDDLTDDEWLIKELHKEIEATAIDFAKWISKNDWMSMWVEDKWMWEYQSSQYGEELPSTHKWFGYKTNEQLFELYKASKQ
jgi:hypothetical protein